MVVYKVSTKVKQYRVKAGKIKPYKLHSHRNACVTAINTTATTTNTIVMRITGFDHILPLSTNCSATVPNFISHLKA